MNELIIESEGRCFLCRSKTFPLLSELLKSPEKPTGKRGSVGAAGSSFCSLQRLSQYLRMGPPQVATMMGDLLFAKPTLKVELCLECQGLNENFSKLHGSLEKLEMELLAAVDLIYRKLKAGKNIDGEEWEERKSKSCIIGRLTTNQKVLNELRNEALNKCSKKLKATLRPRIKLQKLKINSKANYANATKRNEVKLIPNFEEEEEEQASESDPGLPESVSDPLMEPDPDMMEIRPVKLEPPLTPPLNDDVSMAPEVPPVDDNDVKPIIHQNMPPSTGTPPSSAGENEADMTIAPSSSLGLTTTLTLPPAPPLFPLTLLTPQSKLNPVTGKRQCALCSKEFSSNHTFQNHYNVYHLQIKYRCPVCGQDFSKTAYTKHYKQVHMEQKFSCPVCDKRFPFESDVELHLRSTRCISGVKKS